MNGQEAVLDLFGHLTITEIFVWIAAIYYMLSKYKEIYAWLKKWFRKADSNNEALNNAKKLGTFHEQSIEIRTEMQKAIDSIKESIAAMMKQMDEMQAAIEDHNKKLETMEKNRIEENVEERRRNILSFATECRMGVKHDEEQFKQVFSDITAYDRLVKEHQIPNELITANVRYIREIYHECKMEDKFI